MANRIGGRWMKGGAMRWNTADSYGGSVYDTYMNGSQAKHHYVVL
jgi:hypothetical protein